MDDSVPKNSQTARGSNPWMASIPVALTIFILMLCLKSEEYDLAVVYLETGKAVRVFPTTNLNEFRKNTIQSMKFAFKGLIYGIQ